ncbi:MAG: hypothetical protein AAGF97_18000 [Planctomycetota bacterium]
MVAAEPIRYSYLVDDADRLRWVSLHWLGFAQENGAAQLTEEAVLGRSLWDSIADDRTEKLYRALMGRVRKQRSLVVVPFRCDSPSLRRYMQLSIQARERGQLLFGSRVVKIEPRPRMDILDLRSRRSSQVVTLCSLCQKLLIEPAGWMELEAAIAKLHLLEEDTFPRLRYTVCASCQQSTFTLLQGVN